MLSEPAPRRALIVPLALFLGLTTLIVAGAYRYYVFQREAQETDVRNQLSFIADLKVGQLAVWHRERVADSRTLMADAAAHSALRRVIEGVSSAGERDQVRRWLSVLASEYNYACVIVTDPLGRRVISIGRDLWGAEHDRRATSEVLQGGELVVSDFHAEAPGGAIHLSFSIPIRGPGHAAPAGALLLGVDPKDYLYPLIQTWPTPSPSGETLLLRRNGSEILYLNELRHRKGTAMTLTIPLTRTEVPAVQAVLGAEGVVAGADYRGVAVVAALRRVPGTDWRLVAKVDAEEVDAPVRRRAITLGLTVGSLVLAAGAWAAFAWRRERIRFYQERYEAEAERRRLQQQLTEAQRLESIGRLAGGVAHDFNNHLTVINGYCDLVLRRLAEDDPRREPVTQIRRAGESAAVLTRQLLAFSRRQILEPVTLDLNAAVRDAVKLLKPLLGEHIELVTYLDPGLGAIIADPGQIQQILMNLAVNARDAMPDGGKLIVETSNVELDQSYSSRRPEVTPGPYVLLSVTDTGEGMSEETREKIFEPFFTTKAKGAGTGLGLSTVFGIVRQSGGWIWVYSDPGKGTTFKLYFPRTARAPQALPAADKPQAVPGGSETVLVVEDQEDVRKLTVTVLRSLGYTVLEAPSGETALALSESFTGVIHLLITDVVMPGMRGRELAERLTALRPAIRVLYTSGYTGNVIAHQGVLDPGVAYLPKPFTPGGLAAKVREVLAGEDS